MRAGIHWESYRYLQYSREKINNLPKYSEEENLAADEIAERIENLGI